MEDSDTAAKPSVSLRRSTSDIPLPSEKSSSPAASKQVDTSKKRKRDTTNNDTPKSSKKQDAGIKPTINGAQPSSNKKPENETIASSTPKAVIDPVSSLDVSKASHSKKQKSNQKGQTKPGSNAKQKSDDVVSTGELASVTITKPAAKQSVEDTPSKEAKKSPTQALTKRQKKQLNKAEKEAKLALNASKANGTSINSGPKPSSTNDQVAKASGTVTSPTKNSGNLLNALQRLEARFTAMAERHIGMSEQFEQLRREQHDQTVEIARLTKLLWEERSSKQG